MGKPSVRDFGLLGLRAAMGSILFVHGAQKLFGWFGGNGIAGTAVGFGELPVDSLLGHRLNGPWMRNIALASVVPAAAVVVRRRRKALAAATLAAPHLTAESEVSADA